MTPRERRDALFELVVALSIGVLPLLMSAVSSHAPGDKWADAPWWLIMLGYVVHNVAVGVPTLWIIYRSRLPWRYYGLAPSRWWLDLLGGIGLFAATYAFMIALGWALWLMAWVAPDLWSLLNAVQPPADSAKFVTDAQQSPWLLFLVSMTLTTSVEELFTRAYLVPAIARLTRSPLLAAIAAAACMASYHIYQGSMAVVMIFIAETLLNLAFWRWRCIWPFMIGHALYDAVLFLPYMMGHA